MGASIKLMTANLLHGGADIISFGHTLDRVRPDVVVTQELGLEYVEVVEDRFPNHRLRPASGFKGRGIATHLEAEFGDVPMPARYGTSATLTVDGRLWNLAGVHLLNPIEFPWWKSVKGRTGQLEAIEGWAGGVSGPTVIVGDFNASPRWPAYKFMAERWTDLVSDHSSRSGIQAERTWAWRPGWPKMLRIDHVFGSRVIATGVSVEPIEGSDHDAVVVDLTVHE